MESVTTKQVAVRANISVEANQNVEVVKAQFRVDGKKMTKDQVIDIMLKAYKKKK